MKTIMIVASAMLAGVSTPVAAASISVSFADLNIGSRAGMTTLERRIDAAARRICSDNTGFATLSERVATQRCRTETVGDAMNRLQARDLPRIASR